MSPLHVRRYRAERLLRDEFEGLRGRVLTSVRKRLQASGLTLDQGDLEACYAQAWQGLYAVTLAGQEIHNPAGWLVLVTFRRAIEELRSADRLHRDRPLRLQGVGGHQQDAWCETETEGVAEPDLAAELDDRMQLGQLFEGLRSRLDRREREAAALCYLQGLSRAEAASRMGVSETRMRKLMEGHGAGRPGVAGKVGALVKSIRDGNWCEEQGSLMRALAYGMLNPEGERYQLALIHHGQCPACRAYVVSLRGLAVVLPPVFLPGGLGAAILAGAGEGARAGTSGAVLHGGGSAAAASGGGVQATGEIGCAAAACGAAGAGGAAGGGWLIGAGSLSAKLAFGCLLALSVGAGCIAIDAHHGPPTAPNHRRYSVTGSEARGQASAGALAADLSGEPVTGTAGLLSKAAIAGADATLTAAARASREFGPEQALATGAGGAGPSGARHVQIARSAAQQTHAPARSPSAAQGDSELAASAVAQSSTHVTGGDSAAAEREFSPG